MNENLPPAARGRLRVWLRDISISVVASFLIVTFLYQPVRVEGTSMQPGLRDQDRLFIDKFFFRFEKISRGDVVVFRYPRDPEKSYIKRIIALPGDSIFIEHGRVFVNNQPIDELYVPRRYRDSRSMAELIIPPGEYFVMGDHRSISSDSRDFGPVPHDLIYGKATFIYWPADNMGVVH
jgi:signal peptidase I